MTKGFYKILAISLVAHLVLLLLISKQKVAAPKINQQEFKAIKSYLYIPPKPVEKIVATTQESIEDPKTQPKEQEEPPKQVVEKPALNIPEEQINTQAIETNEPATIDKLFKNKEVVTNNNASTKHINPYKALSNLSKQKDDDLASEEAFLNFSKKSFSVMDGDPELVPDRKLEEKPTREERTSSASSYSSITKNDDGTCTLNQDLSHMGAGTWKAKQSMACGESKFDKAYRLHMKKVLGKLTPQAINTAEAPLR